MQAYHNQEHKDHRVLGKDQAKEAHRRDQELSSLDLVRRRLAKERCRMVWERRSLVWERHSLIKKIEVSREAM